MAQGNDDTPQKPATRLVTGGRRTEWTGPVVNPPVWRASTHLYENCAALAEGGKANEDGRFFYGRRGAPTQWALSEALTALEPGAHGTMLYPSGVSAIAGALLAVLRPGKRVLVTDNAYDPSRNMAMGLLHEFGIRHDFFDPLDPDGFAALCEQGVDAVLLESPGSLTMEVCDVPLLAEIAHRHGAVVLLDNTWAGPTGFSALDHGCDASIVALTKHVGGHSDLMMGAVTTTERFYPRLRRRVQQMGIVVSPDDASLALRGLRTLDVRLRQQSESALRIAAWLNDRPEIARVLCPMLPGAPGHELWKRDFTGGCGLFSFVLKGRDADARARLIDALTLYGIGFSWGGFESLALPINPAPLRAVQSWPMADLDPEDKWAIRLSIGLEDPDDLIADLAQAIEKMDV